ncbi:hypothetical protein SAY86_004388, partial [Trapa natans]
MVCLIFIMKLISMKGFLCSCDWHQHAKSQVITHKFRFLLQLVKLMSKLSVESQTILQWIQILCFFHDLQGQRSNCFFKFVLLQADVFIWIWFDEFDYFSNPCWRPDQPLSPNHFILRLLDITFLN